MAAATEHPFIRVALAETSPGDLPAGLVFRPAMTTYATYAIAAYKRTYWKGAWIAWVA